VNGKKSSFNVFNMNYFSALSSFIFKISPFKVVVIWFTTRSQIFKIPKKYDFFSPNTNFFYKFDFKVGRKLSQVMWFECFKSLTHKNNAICKYRWEGWWKSFKILWYFKIPKDYNAFIIFERLKQIVIPKVLLTSKIMDFQNVALTTTFFSLFLFISFVDKCSLDVKQVIMQL